MLDVDVGVDVNVDVLAGIHNDISLEAEMSVYSSVSADCRIGSSGGEVDWWLVRCHLVETVFLVEPT